MTDWDRIVRENGPTVFGTAWRILGHAADTEDVVQEVFLEAYRLREAVRCWPALLRRLASCRALDRLRRRRPSLSLNGLHLAGANGDPEAAAVGNELAARLRQAVAELPEREAAVFCLRYFDEMPNQRIAEVLNIHPGAVGVALHKARAKLAALLTETPTRQ